MFVYLYHDNNIYGSYANCNAGRGKYEYFRE